MNISILKSIIIDILTTADERGENYDTIQLKIFNILILKFSPKHMKDFH